MTLVEERSRLVPRSESQDPIVIEELSGDACLTRFPRAGVGRYVVAGDERGRFLAVGYRFAEDGRLLLGLPATHRVVEAADAAGPEDAPVITVIMHGDGGEVGGPWTMSARGRIRPVDDEGPLRRAEARDPILAGRCRSCRWFEVRQPELEGRHVVGLPTP